MRQPRKTGVALAGGVCAAVLTVSLSACVTGPGPAKAAQGATTAAVAATAPGTGSASARPGRGGHVRVRTVARRTGHTVRIPWRALAHADAIAVAGGRVWVANAGYGASGWLAEIDAATGTLVRIIADGRYRLADPVALAADGNTLWVADGNGDTVTEINAATGALIRVIAGPGYQLADPAAIAAGGGHVWVASAGANSVTEIDAATGALVRVISAPRYRLDTTVYPPAIAVAGNRVWVTDGNSDALTEIDAATGALVRVISDRRYQLNGPDAIAVANGRAWVVNVDSSSVTEIDAATGALIRVVPRLPNVPFGIAAEGDGAWLVTNLGVKAVDGSRPDGSVAELSAGSGRLVRNIGGPPFRSDAPGGEIAAGSGVIWVTDANFYSYRPWLAEISAATGTVLRVIVG
jgi:DNA-binding beta-propeller fold protein YncE